LCRVLDVAWLEHLARVTLEQATLWLILVVHAVQVIEEGEESDEEDEKAPLAAAGRGSKGPGHISPRLQQLQQLSSRATLPKRPTQMSTAASGGADPLSGFDSI
jgi:hypothetical protein